MAEDEREEGDQQDQDENAQKRKKRNWIIAAAVILVLVIGSVAGTLYMLDFFSDEPAADQSGESASMASSSQSSKAAAIYYPLKPEFVTNYEVKGRQRYVQLSITLMLRSEAVVESMELHMPAIRNAIVMLLRGQVYQELQTPEGKELLRQKALLEIQALLEQEIGKPGVEQVLFTNMVMQ